MESPKSVVIGSSNIYRFVKLLDKPLRDIVTLKQCTKMEVYKATMASLEAKDKRVIICVIENFMSDAAKGLTTPETINEAVNMVFREFFEVIVFRLFYVYYLTCRF